MCGKFVQISYLPGTYHVMTRGAGRKPIFKADAQRSDFRALLAEAHERFHVQIHAYCLMGNHYHLLVRTPEGNLQRIMRHLNGVYTQYFNRTEKKMAPYFGAFTKPSWSMRKLIGWGFPAISIETP